MESGQASNARGEGSHPERTQPGISATVGRKVSDAQRIDELERQLAQMRAAMLAAGLMEDSHAATIIPDTVHGRVEKMDGKREWKGRSGSSSKKSRYDRKGKRKYCRGCESSHTGSCSRGTRKCRKCKKLGHVKNECRVEGVMCYNCQVVGHYASQCPKPDIRETDRNTEALRAKSTSFPDKDK